jgi:hypothetical protein
LVRDRRSPEAEEGKMSETPRERRRRGLGPVTFDAVREIALALPGVEDGTSYGTPALKVRGKLLVRLKEDGDSFVLCVGFDLRDILMRTSPETFYITDHYRGYPAVLVRLSSVDPDVLPGLLEQAWREHAPKTLVARFDTGEKR